MKQLTLILISILTFSAFGQVSVKVSGQVFGLSADSIQLGRFEQNNFNPYISTDLSSDGTFAMEGEVPFPDYYVLSVKDKYINIILRDSSDIKVYGDGNHLDQFLNFIGSPESQSLAEYMRILNDFAQKKDAALKEMENNPEQRESISGQMDQEFSKFKTEQQSFIQKNQNSAALYPLLGQIDPLNEFATYESIVKQLFFAFKESPSIQKVNADYLAVKQQKEANTLLATGKEAPDFEEKMPDGSTMKLSDLRGKVVLLDFWASWCGPCRRENPNVVKLYENYKDEGFTVMSVSLDKSKENWQAAIEKDRLSWPYHVSDLQQWSSKVAKQYGVRGIPFTVLIDREGKIIDTKLRGTELEQALQRIFGH